MQLFVLRAELAASDAELEHVRQHLSIVMQQQQGLQGAAGAAAVATAAGSRAQQQQQQPSQPEVEFLRQVGGQCAHDSICMTPPPTVPTD